MWDAYFRLVARKMVDIIGKNMFWLTSWSDDVPSKEFLHESICVRQVIAIQERWKSISADYFVKLTLCGLCSFGEQRHEKDECCNGGFRLRR